MELRLHFLKTLSTDALTLSGVASGYYYYSGSRGSATTTSYIQTDDRVRIRKIYLMQGQLAVVPGPSGNQ